MNPGHEDKAIAPPRLHVWKPVAQRGYSPLRETAVECTRYGLQVVGVEYNSILLSISSSGDPTMVNAMRETTFRIVDQVGNAVIILTGLGEAAFQLFHLWLPGVIPVTGLT